MKIKINLTILILFLILFSSNPRFQADVREQTGVVEKDSYNFITFNGIKDQKYQISFSIEDSLYVDFLILDPENFALFNKSLVENISLPTEFDAEISFLNVSELNFEFIYKNIYSYQIVIENMDFFPGGASAIQKVSYDIIIADYDPFTNITWSPLFGMIAIPFGILIKNRKKETK